LRPFAIAVPVRCCRACSSPLCSFVVIVLVRHHCACSSSSCLFVRRCRACSSSLSLLVIVLPVRCRYSCSSSLCLFVVVVLVRCCCCSSSSCLFVVVVFVRHRRACSSPPCLVLLCCPVAVFVVLLSPCRRVHCWVVAFIIGSSSCRSRCDVFVFVVVLSIFVMSFILVVASLPLLLCSSLCRQVVVVSWPSSCRCSSLSWSSSRRCCCPCHIVLVAPSLSSLSSLSHCCHHPHRRLIIFVTSLFSLCAFITSSSLSL